MHSRDEGQFSELMRISWFGFASVVNKAHIAHIIYTAIYFNITLDCYV